MQVATPLGRRVVPSLGTLIGVLVAAIVVGGAGFFAYQRFFTPTTAPVAQQTAKVTRGTITASVNATGTVASTAASKLGFKSNGRVAELSVAVGDQVMAGQVLARLDTSDLELSVQQARASLAAGN